MPSSFIPNVVGSNSRSLPEILVLICDNDGSEALPLAAFLPSEYLTAITLPLSSTSQNRMFLPAPTTALPSFSTATVCPAK